MHMQSDRDLKTDRDLETDTDISVLGSQPSTCPNGRPKICVDTQEHAWTAYGHPVFW